MTQSQALTARNNLGAAMRHHPNNAALIEQRRIDLAEANIAEGIKRVTDTFPPLTDEARERLIGLLYGGGDDE